MPPLDIGGFPQAGGPVLIDSFGRPLRAGSRIPAPVSGQISMLGGETSLVLGSPPVSGSFQLYRNRILVHPSNYTIAGLTLTLAAGKKFYQNDIIDAFYLTLYPSNPAISRVAIPGYAATVLADAPLAYWRANEVSGTTMFDSSGNGLNATYGPNAQLNQTALYSGNTACVGMSTLDYAAKLVGPTGALLAARTGPWTIECIVKNTGTGSSTGWILAYDKSGNPTSPTPMLGMTYFGAPGVHDQVTSYYSSEVYSPNHTGGSVIHLMLVYDGAGTWTLYENGVQAWSGLATSQSGSVDNIWFLGNSQGTTNGFIGYGCDFAIYNKALSAGRAAAHYASMSYGTILGDHDPFVHVADLAATNSPSASLVVSVDPSDLTSFKFVNAGAASAMTKIAQVVCAGSQASVNFSSIPNLYTDLLIMANHRQTGATSPALVLIKFNNDATAANYVTHRLYSDGVSTTASGSDVASTINGAACFYSSGSASATHPIAATRIEIPNYARTTLEKAFLCNAGVTFNTSNGVSSGQIAGGWFSTAAINKITLTIASGSFLDGSVFTLYGLG